MSNRKSNQNITQPVVDKAQDIWRAGLGAFAMAQQESGKVVAQGARLFDKLVSEGNQYESRMGKKAQAEFKDAEKSVNKLRDAAQGKIESARDEVEQRWNKLERVFEARVEKALKRLGVPGNADVQQLARQVEELSRVIERYQAQEKKAASKQAIKAQAAAVAVSFHLVPSNGDWALRQEGQDADISVHSTKKEALDAARGVAQAQQPSHLIVHRADGTVQNSFSYGQDD